MITVALRNAGPVVTIAGIGGLGKSEAAAAYAAEHRRDYETCMWIDGDSLRRSEDLKAISLWRGGDSRNLAAMLTARKCLVVIDDIADTIATPRSRSLLRPWLAHHPHPACPARR